MLQMGDCIIILFVLSTHSSFSGYPPKGNGNSDLFYKYSILSSKYFN